MKLPATVEAIEPHGEDVFSLRLQPLRRVPAYRPGQFLHLAIDPYDEASHWPESRVFSIATSPTRAAQLRVTFAVKGAFTRRMATELHEGNHVWVKLPYGEFTLAGDPSRETVLVAGGTGITPFVAFLEFLLDRRLDVPVRLFYGARSGRLLLYRPLIDECRMRLPQFHARYFVEADPDAARDGFVPGRLSIEAILREAPLDGDYYLSGPPAMIRSFSAQLAERGVAKARLHVDAWE